MNIAICIFMSFYIIYLFLIAIMDKKYLKIDKKVNVSGIVGAIIYILYLYIINPSSMKINLIYIGIYIILLIADTFIIKRYAKESYTIGILILFNTILIFSGIKIFAYTVVLTAIEILICMILAKVQQKNNGHKKINIGEIPVGYLLGTSNIFTLVATSIITIYIR